MNVYLPFQDVVEVYSLNTIGHVHHFSDDPDLNSVLVFNTIQTKEKFAAMHLFQSDRVPVCTHAWKLPIPLIEFLSFLKPGERFINSFTRDFIKDLVVLRLVNFTGQVMQVSHLPLSLTWGVFIFQKWEINMQKPCFFLGRFLPLVLFVTVDALDLSVVVTRITLTLQKFKFNNLQYYCQCGIFLLPLQIICLPNYKYQGEINKLCFVTRQQLWPQKLWKLPAANQWVINVKYTSQ